MRGIIKNKISNFIKEKIRITHLIYYMALGLSINILYISLDGIPLILGRYEFEEVELKNAYVTVVGRTYARSLWIDKANNGYKASCAGLFDTICTIRDNRQLFASKLLLLRLSKEKDISIVLYVEGEDFSNKRQFVIDNRDRRDDLLDWYRSRQNLLSIAVFPLFFVPLVLLILKVSVNRKYG